MAVLCTICARGGSKGIPNKNIKPLLGKPLIAHTIETALNSKWIDRVVVSTDSEKIAEIAKEYNAEVPFMRPAELSTDTAPKLPVIRHLVSNYLESNTFKPDFVIDLDPTSPLRIEDDIDQAMQMISKDENCDSVITGYHSDKNPYFNMIEIDKNGFAQLSKKNTGKPITSRQEAPPVFSMNASIYIWRTSVLMTRKNIIEGRVKFFEMPRSRSIDIDHEIDFMIVENLMKINKNVSHN